MFEHLDERVIKERKYEDGRDPCLRDRDRILYSRAFRRLAFKTQVVAIAGRDISDHIRSRLTHSLEVMQIASSICDNTNDELKKHGVDSIIKDNLVEAIALAHDIGHTPYGHVGERSLCRFFKGEDGRNVEGLPDKKLKHSFQSLKVCCFLEKQYLPDFYGLNLTVATLDGVLKHSKIDERDSDFYKKCFEAYERSFWREANINLNADVLYELKNACFDYKSPVTLEGVIVSISDEIAQMCHDLEDLRRLSDFETVLPFYTTVVDTIDNIKEIIPHESNSKKIYDDFKNALNKKEEIIKIERLYIKLILAICIPIVSNIVIKLSNMDKEKCLNRLKYEYLGSFEGLINSDLIKEEKETLEQLKKIFEEYEKLVLDIPIIARWDIKGDELIEELSNKLLKAIFDEQEKKLKLNIFKQDMREYLEKSYEAGVVFCDRFGFKNTKVAPKFVIWDYLASMTDRYIINEYESMTFKKVELR